MTETQNQQPKQAEWDLVPELQRSILHLLMTDRDFFVQSIDLIKPHYFADRIHSACYSEMLDHFRLRNQFATRALVEQLVLSKSSDDDIEALRLKHELEMTYERADEAPREREYLLQTIVVFAKRQAVREAILESVTLLREEKYELIEETIRDALSVGLSTDLGDFYFEGVGERYATLAEEESGSEKFSCLFESIDKDIGGGIGRKELAIIFSNKSGVGKSIYLANVARQNVFNGKKVLFLTLENSSLVTAARFDAMFARIPTDQQVSHAEDVISRVKNLQEAFPNSLVIKEYPAGTLTIDGIRAYLQKLCSFRDWRPDLIVVDYLDELAAIKGTETHESQKRLTGQLRALAQQENVSIFTATQSNREGGQRAVATETELGDSYAKVRIVDAMWSINQSDEERARGLARMFVVKHRNGRCRYIFFIKIDYMTMTMSELSEAEYEHIMSQPPPLAPAIPTVPAPATPAAVPFPALPAASQPPDFLAQALGISPGAQ